MARKNQGTLLKVAGTVKKAANAIVETAGEYVVEPVGKALGLIKTTQKRLSAARRKELKMAAKKRTTGRMTASR